jgi:hypothetical protein
MGRAACRTSIYLGMTSAVTRELEDKVEFSRKEEGVRENLGFVVYDYTFDSLLSSCLIHDYESSLKEGGLKRISTDIRSSA